MVDKNQRQLANPVVIWLLTGVFMIMLQVLLGGITRLTGSGLSITEWKPILGAFPPVSEQAWQQAFDQYKQIGQYKHLNTEFTLSDFKFIYFWEWLHRNWARLIGIVFLIPFLLFLWKKRFKKEMVYPLLILFLLGGLQGAIGWIMVKSGLNEENLYVDHIRLMIHFMAALVLLCYTFWFALRLGVPVSQNVYSKKLNRFTVLLLGVLAIQLVYGAFMAGLKAANYAPTWPTINGQWWPDGMNGLESRNNLTDNPITVQFIHRFLAYLLLVLIIIWTQKAMKISTGDWFRKTRWIPILLVLIQVSLGIGAVLTGPDPRVFLWVGISHQFLAMLLLLSLVWMYYLLRPRLRPV